MKVESWDPDLRSLFARYNEGSLDLQPSFQRGLVWNREKKARLLDTLFRGWRIPPVHYLVEQDQTLSILDGQQRLQAIFEFLQDEWPLGDFAPRDDSMVGLRGRRFSMLDPREQRGLLDSRISGYRLSDYEPSEPYELFFGLNLPTGLTQAEKRNALAGKAREQVKRLVSVARGYGWDGALLGFSDGRMAYDDVLARTCAYVSRNTLRIDLSPRDMEAMYRSPTGFSEESVEIVKAAVETVTYALKSSPAKIKMNKATLLTWLLIAAQTVGSRYATVDIAPALYLLETGRAQMGRRDPGEIHGLVEHPAQFAPLVALYTNRASLRVADVLSVQARDAVAWIVIGDDESVQNLPARVRPILDAASRVVYRGSQEFEEYLLSVLVANPDWSILR